MTMSRYCLPQGWLDDEDNECVCALSTCASLWGVWPRSDLLPELQKVIAYTKIRAQKPAECTTCYLYQVSRGAFIHVS